MGSDRHDTTRGAPILTPYYQDDHVTIHHGDSLDILPQLQIGAIVTDPPYGISYTPNGSIPRSRIYDAVIGDDQPFKPEWLLALNVPTILWGANHYANQLPNKKGWLVWRKIAWYVADLELAWTNFVPAPRFLEHEWRGATRGVESGDHFHPTQKPLAVMRWCLAMLPAGIGTIADPYMGSGTTLRAAKDLGLKAVGIEIDERYCQIAAQRCAQEVLPLGLDQLATNPTEDVNHQLKGNDMTGKITGKQAAIDILAENGEPMRVKDLTAAAAKRANLPGKTPAATIAAQIYTLAKKDSTFRIVDRGIVELIPEEAPA